MIILASSSPYRRILLDRFQLPYDTVHPEVDESHRGLAPEALAAYLSELKARTVSERHPEAICIGSDQVPALGAQMLQKPGHRAQNIAQLQQLSGQTVTFYAGLCVLYPLKHICRVSVTKTVVRFLELTDAEIIDYVDREPSFDCAGGFKSEALGIGLFDAIESTDPTALVGLPLIQLQKDLRACGIRILG